MNNTTKIVYKFREDVDQRGLQEVEGQHGHLLVLLVRPGQVALLAVEDDAVGAVPVLHHLEAAVHLLAQLGGGEVVAEEDGAHGPAQLLQGGVGGVLGVAPGEAA
jgi:hypothetical protein